MLASSEKFSETYTDCILLHFSELRNPRRHEQADHMKHNTA